MKFSAAMFLVGVLSLGCVSATYIPMENDWHMEQCPGGGELQYFLLNGKGDAIEVLPIEKEVTVEYDITVYSNGTVIFKELKMEYEGTHLCVRKNGDQIHAHQMPLRIRPLPPTDLWVEVYQSMFATGLISALVIGLIFALGCLVYKKQWKPKPEDEKAVIGYENPTMANYEDEESGSTKM